MLASNITNSGNNTQMHNEHMPHHLQHPFKSERNQSQQQHNKENVGILSNNAASQQHFGTNALQSHQASSLQKQLDSVP